MPGMGWLFGLAKELGIDTKNKSIDQLLKEVNAKKGGAGKAPKAEKGEEPKKEKPSKVTSEEEMPKKEKPKDGLYEVYMDYPWDNEDRHRKSDTLVGKYKTKEEADEIAKQYESKGNKGVIVNEPDEDWDSGEIPEIEPYSEKDLKQDFAEYEEMISAGQYNDAYHLRDYILKQAKSAGMEENEMLNKLITEEGDVVWESPKDSAKVEKDAEESSYTQDDLNTDFREWQDAIRNGETGKAAQLRDYILDNAEKAGMKAGIEIQSLAENKAGMEDVNRLNASRDTTQPASQAPKQSARRDFLDKYSVQNDLTDTEYDIADSVISELEDGYDGEIEDLILDDIDSKFIYTKDKFDYLKENYTPQDLSPEIVQQAYMDFTDDVMEIANKLRAGEGEDNAYFDSNLSYDGRMLAQDIIERIDDFENVPEDELYDRIIDSFNDSIIYYDDQWKILEDYADIDELMGDEDINIYEDIFNRVYSAVSNYQDEQNKGK